MRPMESIRQNKKLPFENSLSLPPAFKVAAKSNGYSGAETL